MSPFLFIDAILHDRPIKVFNNGDMWRDFTYIDDIVEGIVRITSVIPQGNKDWDETNPDPATSSAPYRIYNIGNSQPTRLMDYIHCIENSIGHEAQKTSSPCSRGMSIRHTPTRQPLPKPQASVRRHHYNQVSTELLHGSRNSIISETFNQAL